MNPRKTLYFVQMSLRGQSLPQFYDRFFKQDQNGIPPDTTKKLLIQMLAHCERAVPYYAELIRNLGASFFKDPEQYLLGIPILTKDIIRSRFDDLKSVDLPRREWNFNTSGGSTGEPVRFIQDREYEDRSGALKTLYSKWAGREIGEPEVRLWGSERDIIQSDREGILITGYKPNDYAGALLRLIKDPAMAKKMGNEARKRAVAEFSLELIAQRYVNLYRKLAGVRQA